MPGVSSRHRNAALAVLGLPAGASDVEITQAFRRLARATHPDATGRCDAEAGGRFSAITEAYHRLLPSPEPPSREPASAPPPPRPRQPRTTTSAAVGPQRSWAARPPLVVGPVTVSPLPESGRKT